MSLDLATILPNITHSLEGTGVLFWLRHVC